VNPSQTLFTDQAALGILKGAANRARELDHEFVDSEHLLLQLLHRDNGVLHSTRNRFSRRCGLNYDIAYPAIVKQVVPTGPSEDGSVTPTSDFHYVFAYAVALAMVYSKTPVFSVQHLLLAVLAVAREVQSSGVARLFKRMEIDIAAVEDVAWQYSGFRKQDDEDVAEKLCQYVNDFSWVSSMVQAVYSAKSTPASLPA
jgi:ATP-dependent Clp protease ATP-binding subunit ClpA